MTADGILWSALSFGYLMIGLFLASAQMEYFDSDSMSAWTFWFWPLVIVLGVSLFVVSAVCVAGKALGKFLSGN
jgi:hypothetical protein